MNSRKFLFTVLATLSISAGTMAQGDHRHFKEVPKGGKEIVYQDVHYHYAGGKFYRPHNEGYDIVEAPIGMEVNNLPSGYKVRKEKGVNYYYNDEVCFKRGSKKGFYVVVKRPW